MAGRLILKGCFGHFEKLGISRGYTSRFQPPGSVYMVLSDHKLYRRVSCHDGLFDVPGSSDHTYYLVDKILPKVGKQCMSC